MNHHRLGQMSGTFPDEVKAMARLVCRCARSRSNFDVRPCLRKQTFQITKWPGECRMRFPTSSRLREKSPFQHSQKILSFYAPNHYVSVMYKFRDKYSLRYIACRFCAFPVILSEAKNLDSRQMHSGMTGLGSCHL